MNKQEGTESRPGDGFVHLANNDSLDACGQAGPGWLTLSEVPDDITCPECMKWVHA